ncbi:hypothetical protein BU26DRAFT_38729 [Trematosphaeria pertusa]|uniref:Uncharacterized protein n=1 Tax=Trematosphaeria pertusa TaxID=390896 RepID=A0A6A6J3D5_9PLEO|nr:uncharacterized protein BU26DRAFT_38729 [Trematosphaeria pertusa]KAF2257219.1 hypothetical protein BU26DRAFT_38729 [Trematosphaeria pertusa]
MTSISLPQTRINPSQNFVSIASSKLAASYVLISIASTPEREACPRSCTSNVQSELTCVLLRSTSTIIGAGSDSILQILCRPSTMDACPTYGFPDSAWFGRLYQVPMGFGIPTTDPRGQFGTTSAALNVLYPGLRYAFEPMQPWTTGTSDPGRARALVARPFSAR